MRANFSPVLLDRLRRPDSKARLIVEACVTAASDIRQRKDQWAAMDSTTGLELRDDGGVGLDPAATAILTQATTNAYWRSTDERHQRVDLQVVSMTRVAGTVTVTIES